MDKVILKEGREKSVVSGHPWIFSGAVDSLPDCAPGEVFPIYSSKGDFLAQGYFHQNHSLLGRVLTRSEGPILPLLKEAMVRARDLRTLLFSKADTNAMRLINGEGDGFPGLIVDDYDGHLVMQIHTQGMERLKSDLIEMILEVFQPKSLFEKSRSSSRVDDGLEPIQEGHYRETPEVVTILENGHRFFVSIPTGQKTGFFLDQREMRALVGTLSKERRVLNCFAYTGGFSLYAAAGGAKTVTSVDRCQRACALASQNLSVYSNHSAICSDIQDIEMSGSDFIILDPPAFAKKRRHLDAALKAYQTLNEKAFRAIDSGGLLLTCSCSHFVDSKAFKHMVFAAAKRAGRQARILSGHIQASDHPIALAHPEGGYLKSLLLFVD